MSHSTGLVRFPDGTVRWFEYDGTTDYVRPKLYNTQKELSDNWREEYRHSDCECRCKRPSLEYNEHRVELFADYGYGFTFEGGACPVCNAIIWPRVVDYSLVTRQKPEWVTAAFNQHLTIDAQIPKTDQ